MSSTKATLRLAESIDNSGKITRRGADKLIATIDEFDKIADSSGCAELMAFATSAVRDAKNSDDVLARVRKETGVQLQVLRGVDESRLTFLAVRRWYGWSAGRIINLDIGGGSLELSNGVDEEPEVAMSLPLGAGRLTREWLNDDPPGRRRVAMLRDWLDAELADGSAKMLDAGSPDLAVATSKTFRSLARLTGAAPSAAGPRVKRTLTANGLRQLISFISRMTTADRAELEGVSAERAPQIVAGALVAEASMRALSIETVDICPWALREGLILRKLDSEADGTAFVETSVRDAGSQRADRNRRQTMTGPHDTTPDPSRLRSCWPRTARIGAPVAARRRRRRGNADAVTVAELTGEIPVIAEDIEPDDDGATGSELACPPRPTAAVHVDEAVSEEPAAKAPFWSEPEPRWPESAPPRPRESRPEPREPRPERSSYPLPVRDNVRAEANRAG